MRWPVPGFLSRPPGAFRAWSPAREVWGAIFSALVCCPALAVGGAPGTAAVSERDCSLMLDALRALKQDEQLASLNLGVTVKDHVVTLWGPIPSAALAQRAREEILQVQGVADVINELQIERPKDPLLENLDLPFLHSHQALLAWVNRQPPGGQNGRPALAVRDPVPGQELVGSCDRQRPAEVGTLLERNAGRDGLAAQDTAGSLGRAVVLGPPVAAVGPASEVTCKTPVVLLTPVPASDPGSDLFRAVEGLRRANPRLNLVRTEVAGGVVRLHGTVYRGEDILALARAIARLPGVERVVLEDVRTARP